MDDIRELDAAEYQQMIWDEMSERTWGIHFERLCKEHGWLYYHTFQSEHSTPGYPDYHCIRGFDEFYAELKTEFGTLTDHQVKWRQAITGLDHAWYCWRPSNVDEVISRLSEHEYNSGIGHVCDEFCHCRPIRVKKRAKKKKVAS